jgi:hypothetical protein
LPLSWFLSRHQRTSGGPYIHVDLHSGTGQNHHANCKGSPAVFLDAARKHGVPYHAFFIDKRRESLDALRARTALQGDLYADAGAISYICADNRAFLPTLPDRISQETRWRRAEDSRGSVLCDPNGISGDRCGFPPLDLFAAVMARLPRWIVLIHYNYGASARTAGYNRSPVARGMMATLPLEAILSAFSYRHWLIADPGAGHGRAHTVLCGSHVPIPPHPAGLHALDSPEGRRLRERCAGVWRGAAA